MRCNRELSGFIIVGVMIIFILIFWIWIMSTIRNNLPSNTYYLQCPVGQCPTNFINGEKRCLEDENIAAVYDPAYEVCNSRYTCENSMTKYAVQEDGSTDINGICPVGSICRCLPKPLCASSTIVTFSSQNGVLSGGLSPGDPGSTSVIQNAHRVQGNTGISLGLDNSNTQYCTISPIYMNRMIPRTDVCNFSLNPSFNDVINCVKSNPCTMGILAYKPSDINTFSFKNPNKTPNIDTQVGCFVDRVSFPKCSGDRVPVWDYTSGSIVCKP